MGWKYEVDVFFYESDGWRTGYMGNSLYKAVLFILKAKKRQPGRAYQITIR